MDSSAAFPFLDGFAYAGDALAAQSIPLARLVAEYRTPLYVYNLDAVAARYREWDAAFGPLPHRINYAVKANSSLALLRHLGKAGSGFDVNSAGELFRTLKAGGRPERITMTGVGKTAEDIRAALTRDILFLNAESLEECFRIDAIAQPLERPARIVLRINPDIDVRTHPSIATGLAEHKFGISPEEALAAIPLLRERPNLRIAGFGMHIGSQILDPAPFVSSVARMLAFIDAARPLLAEAPAYLNIGGGVGVRYRREDAELTVEDFLAGLKPLLEPAGMTVTVEPGRFLTANAGLLLTQVLYVKKTRAKTFVIVDAGMNDLIRPTLYDAFHEIIPLRRDDSRPAIVADVVGPVCESGDYFARDRSIPEPREGEYLAICSAGAYGAAMSSRYNSRAFAAEAAIRGGEFFLARRRETFDDMIANELLP